MIAAATVTGIKIKNSLKLSKELFQIAQIFKVSAFNNIVKYLMD